MYSHRNLEEDYIIRPKPVPSKEVQGIGVQKVYQTYYISLKFIHEMGQVNE